MCFPAEQMSLIGLGVFWGGIWARGTTSQEVVERMRRGTTFSCGISVFTGIVIDLFPNLTILKGSMESIASCQTYDMSCAVS